MSKSTDEGLNSTSGNALKRVTDCEHKLHEAFLNASHKLKDVTHTAALIVVKH